MTPEKRCNVGILSVEIEVLVRLDELRMQKPYTQRELAAAADVAEITIRSIENGYAGRLRPRTMRVIAEALGVKPADVDEFASSLRPSRVSISSRGARR